MSHTSLALRLGHTEPGNTQAAPGSQPRTEIKELCSELQFPTWGSGAPESAQLRQKCLLSGTHGQPQLDQFLNGLSKSQDISANYLNPELFVLHCHCSFKHNKNHQAPLPRSAILLKPSKSQENKIMSGKKEAVNPCFVHYRKMAFYWAAHCNERRDTQEGCNHEAAPRSHLPVIDRANACCYYHCYITKSLWEDGSPFLLRHWTNLMWTKYRSSNGRKKELMPKTLKTGLSYERMWKTGTEPMYRRKEQVESVEQNKCVRTASVLCSVRNEGVIEKNLSEQKLNNLLMKLHRNSPRKNNEAQWNGLKFPLQ